MFIGCRLSERGARLLLPAVVLGAMSLSLVWTFRVPIFQAPDEPLHLDYALALHAHGGLFRAADCPPLAVNNGYENIYTHNYVHAATNFLMKYTSAGTIAFNPAAKVAADYGSREYFRQLDLAAPQVRSAAVTEAPFLFRLYPFGYYALLAGWMGCLGLLQDSLVFVFFGARVLSVLLLGGSLVLMYATSRRMRLGRGWSLLLTAAVGFFPLTSFVTSYVQPDNLSLFLVSLCLYLSLVVRRDVSRLSLLGLLGVALGALLVTKVHYFLAVAVPVGGMLAGELWRAPVAAFRRAGAAVLVLFPSLVTGSMYLWTQAGQNFAYHSATVPTNVIPHFLLWTRRALRDFYIGPTHRSFWGVFGWLDTPLVFHDETTSRAVRITWTLGTLAVLVLTLIRLGQVAPGLWRLLRRGRLLLAWRIAFSNPVVNSYFLFSALMVCLYVWMQNSFGAQGRNWLPLILPIFLTGVAFIPRVFRRARSRLVCAATIMAVLLAYDLFGSYYALASIDDRYYPPFRGQPVQTVPLIRDDLPVWMLTFGPSESLEFPLYLPQFIYGIQLRYALTNQSMERASLQVIWKSESGPRQEQKASFFIIPGADVRTLTVCVNDTIDRFRIVLDDKPCNFDLREITLLQKPADAAPADGSQ